jgi:DedD protein
LEQAVKQRLVGAAVLTALAVITLPLIFDTGRPPAVQVTEVIPPAPETPAVAMPEPQPVELPADRPTADPVPVGEMYQMADKPADTSATVDGAPVDGAVPASPDGMESPVQATTPAVEKPVPVSKPLPAKPVAPKTPAVTDKKPLPPLPAAPGTKLDAHGLPESWVVQVAAVSDASKADSLVAELKLNGYAAFTRKQDGTIRVLVGPKAYKADAARLKQQLDREMKTQSMLKPFAAK